MDLAKRILMVFLCCVAAFVAPADEPSAFAEKPVAPSIPWKLPSYTLVARDMISASLLRLLRSPRVFRS